VQAESGSLAHDATFQTTLVDDNMSLQLVFRNEANNDLPYGTKTIFQQLITAEPEDGTSSNPVLYRFPYIVLCTVPVMYIHPCDILTARIV